MTDTAASGCTYTDLGGNTRPCDPRWPFRTVPPDGATADQVAGWNAMCPTQMCIAMQCSDGRIYHIYNSGICTVAPVSTRPVSATQSAPAGTATGSPS